MRTLLGFQACDNDRVDKGRVKLKNEGVVSVKLESTFLVGVAGYERYDFMVS